MIKVYKKNNVIEIIGHADYADAGQDIVCAAASSITTVTVNAILRFNNKAIVYKNGKDKFIINIQSDDEITNTLITNMLAELQELALTYPKNIKVLKEE